MFGWVYVSAGYGPFISSWVSTSDADEGWPLADEDPPPPPGGGTTQSYYWQLLSGGALGVGV